MESITQQFQNSKIIKTYKKGSILTFDVDDFSVTVEYNQNKIIITAQNFNDLNLYKQEFNNDDKLPEGIDNITNEIDVIWDLIYQSLQQCYQQHDIHKYFQFQEDTLTLQIKQVPYLFKKIDLNIKFKLKKQEVSQEELQQVLIKSLLQKVNYLEKQLNQVQQNDQFYTNVVPQIDNKINNNQSYILENENKTSTCIVQAWNQATSENSLLQYSQGKKQVSFKVKIENLTPNKHVMVGIYSKNFKDNFKQPCIYNRTGTYFCYFHQRGTVYQNGSTFALNTEIFKDDVITVLVDLEQLVIQYKVNDYLLYNSMMRINPTYLQDDINDLYPVIQFHDKDIKLTFIN